VRESKRLGDEEKGVKKEGERRKRGRGEKEDYRLHRTA